MITLAFSHGQPVSAVTLQRRWLPSVQFVMRNEPSPTYLTVAEAYAELGLLCRTSLKCEREGDPMYRVLAREAVELNDAINAVEAHRARRMA